MKSLVGEDKAVKEHTPEREASVPYVQVYQA